MITPEEIRNQCLNWWKDVLISTVEGLACFPREINRIGRITSKDILNNLNSYTESIALLKKYSKTGKRAGYSLITAERRFDKIGLQLVPEKFSIDSVDDYLAVTGKKIEYHAFVRNLSLIKGELPQLSDWIKANPYRLVDHDTWADTLKVCQYFIQNPKPHQYIRQLPIDVHTKYIVDNKAIITSLLNHLIPDFINSEERDFEKRFNLLSKEQLIRIRFLDAAKSPLQNITDISFTEKELMHYNFVIDKVFITENLMNFLTLPCLENTIAIWSGGGFNISYLRNIQWLKEKQFYYWGDIDAQGFQILNQCRGYFPNTVAVMMDFDTLNAFPYASGFPAKEQNLIHLTAEEFSLYRHVLIENIRLEQEKITQVFAEGKIAGIG